jgi:hypothetical protein
MYLITPQFDRTDGRSLAVAVQCGTMIVVVRDA